MQITEVVVHQTTWATWLWVYGAMLLAYLLSYALINRVQAILQKLVDDNLAKILGTWMMNSGTMNKDGTIAGGGILPKGWPGTGGKVQ